MDGPWEPVPAGKLRRESSGLVFLRLDHGAELDLPTARALVARLNEVMPTPTPFLADISGLKWIDKDARDVIAGGRYASPRAIVVHTTTARVMAQLFENLHNPEAETRTFTSEQEARAWLAERLDASERSPEPEM